ncbi:hypothetical protein ACJX0J_010211, partial [Zea mays]
SWDAIIFLLNLLIFYNNMFWDLMYKYQLIILDCFTTGIEWNFLQSDLLFCLFALSMHIDIAIVAT